MQPVARRMLPVTCQSSWSAGFPWAPGQRAPFCQRRTSLLQPQRGGAPVARARSDSADEKEVKGYEGKVESVLYYDSKDGFSVVCFQAAEERIGVSYRKYGQRIKVVAHFEKRPQAGALLRMEGSWEKHPKHGDQLAVHANHWPVQPRDEQGLLDMLNSLPRMGPKRSQRLVSHFGPQEMWDVLEDPGAEQLLQQCSGVGQDTACKIVRAYKARHGELQARAFLGRHNVQGILAGELVRLYGAGTERALREDPYAAFRGTKRGTFQKADELAQRLRLPPDMPSRAGSALVHELLSAATTERALFLRWRDLRAKALALMSDSGLAWPAASSDLSEPAKSMLREKKLVMEASGPVHVTGDSVQYSALPVAWDSEAIFYASRWHAAEVSLATHLSRLANGGPLPRELPCPPQTWIDRLEGQQGARFSAGQRAAIEAAMKERVVIVTGGPGCGKTFVTRAIVKLWRDLRLNYALAAPTGRAASRLEEAVGSRESAKTIHRMLGWRGSTEAEGRKSDTEKARISRSKFEHNESNPLGCEALLLDETSMLDLELGGALLSALRSNCQLIFVGDADQLPPVAPGNVLGAVIASRLAPVVDLRELFRQAAESQINRGASQVNADEFPSAWHRSDAQPYDVEEVLEQAIAEKRDAVWFNSKQDQQSLSTLKGTIRHLTTQGGYAVKEILVLAPQRKGLVGVNDLNTALQQQLNPPTKGKAELELPSGKRLRVGDRVIQVVNDYKKDVMNGELGVLETVYEEPVKDLTAACTAVHEEDSEEEDSEEEDSEEEDSDDDSYPPWSKKEEPALIVCTIRFASSPSGPTKLVGYGQEDLDNMQLAWATTVHKAQGSESPAVVLVLSERYWREDFLTRRLLYTAMTRAKKLLVVIGPESTIAKAVKCISSDLHLTRLPQRLEALRDALKLPQHDRKTFGP